MPVLVRRSGYAGGNFSNFYVVTVVLSNFTQVATRFHRYREYR